jgi:hypothetical protein
MTMYDKKSFLLVTPMTHEESLAIHIETITYCVTIGEDFSMFLNKFLNRKNLSLGFNDVVIPYVSLYSIIPVFGSSISPSPSDSVSE